MKKNYQLKHWADLEKQAKEPQANYSKELKYISYDDFCEFLAPFHLSNNYISHILDISTKTLERNKNNNIALSRLQNDLYLDINLLILHGIETFGNEEKFIRWMQKDSHLFENKSPIEIIYSTLGRQKIIQELENIQQGLFI